MNNVAWHTLVALILALGAATSVVLLSISVLTTPGHVTGEESTLLSTVLGATVGAAAAYIGRTVSDGDGTGSG